VTEAICGLLARNSGPIDLRRAIPPAEDGQTTTEYAVVLSVVVIALAAALFALEGPIGSFIGKVADELAAVLP
jgi:Flp pilus assembly pilin Flp